MNPQKIKVYFPVPCDIDEEWIIPVKYRCNAEAIFYQKCPCGYRQSDIYLYAQRKRIPIAYSIEALKLIACVHDKYKNWQERISK